VSEIDEAVASGEAARGDSANHEGQLEQVQGSGRFVTVTGWARDRASPKPIQVDILVGGAVRTTVTANRRRPNGQANGFSATIAAPSQPANVCARTVAAPPFSGVMLGCRQPAFPVPIRVVTEPGKSPPPGQVASFFWVNARGDIEKDLVTVPIVNGVAQYVDRPLPRGLSWAITVHDPTGRPLFRSGPLPTLPGPASDLASFRTIKVFRSSTPASTGLNSDDAGLPLLARRLAQLPRPLRFDSVQIRSDSAGHEVVVVRGRVRLAIISRTFTYTLPVALRPATAPGRPADVVVAERGGQASFTGPDLNRFRDVLDKAILEGVELALDGGLKLIATIELGLHDVDFPASHVSVTSIEVRGPTTNPSMVAQVHAGTITDPGDIVIDG
jgi:hypothetical protein